MTSTAVHRRRAQAARTEPATVRVAIYARKSTEHGLEQAFTTIDNQIASCRSYLASQKDLGWIEVGEPYMDPGYSAKNLKRPAMQRLLAEVEAGRLDLVLVYKMDRLSRRQLDLLNVLETFDKHGVRFVSVTEPFTTATPMGRAMINMLGAFAQLERETIALRVKDKMLASRQRGMWQGGPGVYGYGVIDKKLVVNEEEASVVREIFGIFARTGSLTGTLDELRQRAINNKRWITKKGKPIGGRPFNRDSLYNLLRNVHLHGMIPTDGEPAKGEHAAVVSEAMWNLVQTTLDRNHGGCAHVPRAKSGAILQALLVCAVCGSAMTPTHTLKGATRYSYYACGRTKKAGAAACPGSRVAAGTIEKALIAYLRQVARDPVVIAATVEAARKEISVERDSLVAELRRHESDVRRQHSERTRITEAIAQGASTALADRLAEVECADALAAERITQVQAEIDRLTNDTLDEAALRDVLLAFDPVWAELGPAEKARVVALLLERVTYDGRSGEVKLEFRADGVRALLEQAS